MDQVMVVESAKPFEETCRALEAAVAEHRFGVLHVHDVQRTLAAKGLPLDEQVRVFDVCNPQRAKQVLDEDPVLSVALPCAISVFTRKGRTQIAFIRPTILLGLVGSDRLGEVAREVETAMTGIVERAATPAA